MAGSRKNIKNFDISYKMAICEEYLELIKQNDSLSKRDFAISKGIKPTTFYDWINTYSSYKDNESNDEEITTTNSELTPVPKFVQLSKNKEDDTYKVNKDNDNKIILRYKDVSLEFNDTNIDKALEIIRRW